MLIRFGYVAMSLQLEKCSPSKTITLANLKKINSIEGQLGRLRSLAENNLDNTMRLLYHNQAHQIHLYRFTSKLVPLVTHPEAPQWNYVEELEDRLKKIGDYVKKHQMRVSAHPDHFTLINSPDPQINETSLKDLVYHQKIFQAMGLGKEAKLVMHVGGLYKNKEQSIRRFKDNFHSLLPSEVKERLVLENDDKSYTAADVLAICEELQIPMVLDIHHHRCCGQEEILSDLLPRIFATWQGQVPKIHLSSPKEAKNFRHHANDIILEDFLSFLHLAKGLDQDFDVMIEAKNKDVALFNLLERLKEVEGIKVPQQASIIF